MTTAKKPSGEAPSYVVGIGASAGGLEALQQFVAALSPGNSLALVIIQHLSPDFESHMEELLGRHTLLRVRRAEHEMVVQRDEIYVMPPKVEVRIENGRLLLSPRPPAHVNWQPINRFFASLAEDAGRHGIAVVLSGAGTDGAAGIAEVHRAGGLVLAQSEETAMFAGMPSSAVATGLVHRVQSPAQLAKTILKHAAQQLDATTRVQPAGVHSLDANPPPGPASRSGGVPRQNKSARQPSSARQSVDHHLLSTYDRLLERYMPQSILVNAETQVVHVFGGAEKFLRHRGGRVSHHLLDLLEDSLRDTVGVGLHQALRSGETASYRDLPDPAAGESARLTVTIEPMLDQAGVVDQFLIHFQSIQTAAASHPVTDELIDGEPMRRSEGERATRDRAIDAAASGIMIVDATQPDWPIAYVNDGFEKITGYARQEVLGRNCELLQGPETDPHAIATLRAAIEKRSGCHVTLRHYQKNGKPFWNELRLSPVSDEAGETTHFVIIHHDVTRQFDRQQAAAASEREYRELFDSATVGVAQLDADGRWSRVNRWLCEILGYNEDELLGMTFHQLTDPEDLEADAAQFESLVRGELEVCRRESRYHHRDGHIVWVLLNLSRRSRSDGQFAGALAVIQDITERKQTELTLLEARRMADSANRAKSNFVINMSHELRSPMTAVLGFAEMLADELKSPEQLEKVGTLKRNGEYLLRLLDEVLDLSKIEARGFGGDTEPCDLILLVDEVEQLMRGHADQMHIDLHFNYPTLLPKTIYTSSTRVRQILMNLVADAVKSPLQPAVHVTIRYRQQQIQDEPDQGWIELEIADTAIGSNDLRTQAFIPLAQADPEVTGQLAGRALGLQVTKRVVAALGGTLELASEPGGGVVLLARLPVGEAADLELVKREANQADSQRNGRPVPPRCIAGKILVADDRRDIWQVTKYFLERCGAEVAVAEDGRQAVDAVQAAATEGEPFDLVLLDMQMPIMDGIETVRALRGAGFSLPIIALTADAMKGERKKCLAAGCNDYLTKPIDVSLLTETVARHLGQKAC